MRFLGIATVLLSVTLFCVMVAGCGSSTPANPLVGVWDATSATWNGESAPLAQVFNWDEGVESMQIELKSDGTLEARLYDAESVEVGSQDGEWSASGNQLTIDFQDDQQDPEPSTYNITGNILTITITEGEGTLVLTLTKA